MSKKFWQFKNVSESEAELLLYGPISEYSWWGDEVTPKQFIEDLKALGDVSRITVRINSGGGDVFAAHAIYTQLKDHKAEIIVKIDGLAASAATIIAMAGDTVKIPENAMMMVHNPAIGLLGYYNSDELDKFSDILDSIKNSIIAAYKKKTKKDDKEISKLMDKETWMTGQEAVDMGFADEVMFNDPVDSVMNGNLLIVNNISHDLSKFKTKPLLRNTTFRCNSQPSAPVPQPAVNNIKPKEGVEPMFKDVKELRNAYPELVKQIEDAAREEGRKEERTRIQEIEQIANTIKPELVNRAKFEQPITAKDLAFEAMKQNAMLGQQFMQNLNADNNDSNVNAIQGQNADAGDGDSNKPKTVKDRFKNIAANFDAKRRGVKVE